MFAIGQGCIRNTVKNQRWCSSAKIANDLNTLTIPAEKLHLKCSTGFQISLRLDMYIYFVYILHTHIYIYMYICIYICIYIYHKLYYTNNVYLLPKHISKIFFVRDYLVQVACIWNCYRRIINLLLCQCIYYVNSNKFIYLIIYILCNYLVLVLN